MLLITELNQDLQYIAEGREDGSKNHYITGVFMQAEQVNRNGRKYPIQVMERAVQKYIESRVNNRTAYGELGHPQGPQINLDRVSHIITELKREGNDIMGKARLTDTPMGNIAKGLLESGANLGVSSRGLGSIREKNGIMEVQNDFHLATAADIVADPSAPNAFVKGILENVEWVYDASRDTWYQEQLHESRKNLRNMTSNQREEVMFNLFESFMNKLSRNN